MIGLYELLGNPTTKLIELPGPFFNKEHNSYIKMSMKRPLACLALSKKFSFTQDFSLFIVCFRQVSLYLLIDSLILINFN